MTAQKKREILTGGIAALLIVCAVAARVVTRGHREAPYFLPVSLLRSFIYIGLMMWWGISLWQRIIQTQVRRYLAATAALYSVLYISRIPWIELLAGDMAEITDEARQAVYAFIPNIIIRKTKPLGYYGRLHKAYLEMHRPILFNELVLSDKLFEHCAEIDEAARNRMELIVRSLAERNGVTEQLKAENQMEWVRQMNACKAQAEEVVKFELIYD